MFVYCLEVIGGEGPTTFFALPKKKRDSRRRRSGTRSSKTPPSSSLPPVPPPISVDARAPAPGPSTPLPVLPAATGPAVSPDPGPSAPPKKALKKTTRRKVGKSVRFSSSPAPGVSWTEDQSGTPGPAPGSRSTPPAIPTPTGSSPALDSSEMQVDSAPVPRPRDQMPVFLPKGTFPTPFRDFLSAHPLQNIPLASATNSDFHGFDARALMKWLGRGFQDFGCNSILLEDIAEQYTVWRSLTEGGNAMGLD